MEIIQYRTSVKNGEYLEILNSLLELQLNKECILFFELAGHVDRLSIRLRDKDNYSREICNYELTFDNWSSPKKINIEDFIKEVKNKVIEYNDNIIEREKFRKEKIIKEEKKQYKILKAKFEK